MKPIKPEEVETKFSEGIPDYVIGAFNDLIVENWSNVSRSSKVKQEEVISLICSSGNILRKKIFVNKWLDIEPLYENIGWSVNYHRSACNEGFEAYFEFCKK